MFVTYVHFLLYCRNRQLYSRLAKKHGTTVWHVYRVAHGKRINTMRDGCIFRELHREGILE